MSDQLFCLLISCIRGITLNKLVYSIYLLQFAGFDLKYRFTLQQNGIRCRLLTSYVDEILDMRYLCQEEDKIKTSKKGIEYIDNYILSIEDWEKLNYIIGLVNNTDIEKLHFCVLTNIVYSEVTKSVTNTTEIFKLKSQISEAILNIYGEYTHEEFEEAFKIIRTIKYFNKMEVNKDDRE